MAVETAIEALVRAAAERGLPSLVIGAHAVILLGYLRNTADFDLLVPEENRSEWLDLLRELNFGLFRGTDVFAQFESKERPRFGVDLMFVDAQTWNSLRAGALPKELGDQRVLVPRPEHLVALKLHAASSPGRSKPVVDWEDIRQIVRICALDPEETSFRELILRYGGEDALTRIRSFR